MYPDITDASLDAQSFNVCGFQCTARGGFCHLS
uniref:Uncharacterized protein n=1 Tax=Anguilla anguilla TaxID=7936 RepID=A0A0E9U145_ANGAN